MLGVISRAFAGFHQYLLQPLALGLQLAQLARQSLLRERFDIRIDQEPCHGRHLSVQLGQLHANLLRVFARLAQHLLGLLDRLLNNRVGVIKHINQGLGDLPHRVSNFKRGTLSLGPPPSISSPSRRQDWDDYGSTQLDDLGNWLNFSDDGTADARTHNTANEIESRTYGGQNRTIAYDAAGNLETLQTADNAFWMFVYDYRNRVIEVKHKTTPPAEWASIAKYFYDAFNRRIEKVLTTGNDVVYLYEGWRCIEEREWDENGEGEEDDAWEPRRQYVYGGQYIDEPVLFDKDTDDDEEIDVSYWYLHDTNYNVVALADATGSTLERCWYEPYGEATISDADGGTQETVLNDVEPAWPLPHWPESHPLQLIPGVFEVRS